MNEKNEILLGAGEVYMYEFKGLEMPDHAEIEKETHNVGHCSGGFVISYKPTKYDIINQYERVVKSFITKEEISAKTGVLTWQLSNLALFSTAKYVEDKIKKVKSLVFTGKGKSLTTVMFRFVHKKENGKKLRFTMIGQGGAGFELAFEGKEVTVDAEIAAIQYLDGFFASFEEELTDEEAAALIPEA